MVILLERELTPIKAGWSSGNSSLHLMAHGYSQEVADKNLQRAAAMYFAVLRRGGYLDDVLVKHGLQADGNSEGIEVVLR